MADTEAMNVAVITFTRDRLEYTQHCFASLQDIAGCDYDHYVLDNASDDDTPDWLEEWSYGRPDRIVELLDVNIGICRGANHLLGLLDPDQYDVVVRFDNDCEVITPGTLKVTAQLAAEYGVIVAPEVNGLMNPPARIRTVSVGGYMVDETAILGGIFMAIPAFLFTDHGFRWNENSPLGTGDEAIVPWWRAHGGVCGYLQGYSVNHYETTAGQRERFPAYFERHDRELVT